jgi:adenylate kinase family enzyme
VVITIGRKAQQARLLDRFARALALIALRVECEVDHHDRVLLDDADQQDDADDAHHAQVGARDQQREQRADPAEGSVERIVTGWM